MVGKVNHCARREVQRHRLDLRTEKCLCRDPTHGESSVGNSLVNLRVILLLALCTVI